TPEQHKKMAAADEIFVESFKTVPVEEPDVETATSMLRAGRSYYEESHDVRIPDEALVTAVKASHQIDQDGSLPRKAVDLVRGAAEAARPDSLRMNLSVAIREMQRQLAVALGQARQALVETGKPLVLALPGEIYNRVAGLVESALVSYRELSGVQDGEGLVTPDLVERELSQKTGVPISQVARANRGDDIERYIDMEGKLSAKVINQEVGVAAVSKAVRRNKAGLSDPTKPLGNFIFLGPTGVGKTHLAKMLAEFLFDTEEAMLRLDMTEYMEKHSVSSLTGAPPGYIGYEEEGQLTGAVRHKPYSVVLYDEFEKAHPDVMNVFLPILDDGRLTDKKGRTVNFKNTINIFSSNAGMDQVPTARYEAELSRLEGELEKTREELESAAAQRPGLEDRARKLEVDIARVGADWDADIERAGREALKELYKPEFLNRFDDIIVFNRLTRNNVRAIARLQMDILRNMVKERQGIDLEWTEEAIELLVKEGYSSVYGARPLKRAIQNLVVDRLTDWTLAGAGQDARDGSIQPASPRGSRIRIGAAEGRMTFEHLGRAEDRVERVSLEGAAERVTRELMDLVERLAAADLSGDHDGVPAAPTEGFLDSLLRAEFSGRQEAKPAGPAPSRTFAPGESAAVPEPVAWVSDGDRFKKDSAVDDALADVARRAKAAGWPARALALLEPGLEGETWPQQFLYHAARMAAQAEAAEPPRLAAQVEPDRIRLVIHGAHEMTAGEKEFLDRHFTGEPPRDMDAAQQLADHIQVSENIPMDSNMLYLHRLLKDAPGARMGYAQGEQAAGGRGTDYWLELVGGGQAPAAAASAPSQKTPAAAPAESIAARGSLPAGKLTPEQVRARRNVKAFLLEYLNDQQGLGRDQDKIAGRLAAAEGWAGLASDSDLPTARKWLDEAETPWPLALAAAVLLERRGGPQDKDMLEDALRRAAQQAGHDQKPLRGALTRALAATYARAGRQAALDAYARSAEESDEEYDDASDMRRASQLALGQAGTAEDLSKVDTLPEAHVALLWRAAPIRLARLLKIEWPLRPGSDGRRALEAFRQGVVAEPRGELRRMAAALAGFKAKADPNELGSGLAEAFAATAARAGRTRGLGRELSAFGGKAADARAWPVLLALVLTAQKAADAEALPALEAVLDWDPAQVHALNEQAYFQAPLAWARTVVEGGRYDAFAAQIDEMAGSSNPMRVAAALHAMRLEAAREVRSYPPAKGTLPSFLARAG
ncbi:MAG: ATP-dependent Clp protease ATP-binding subunit, partial [Elusimicrobia bacterium]|nr:ATP-dependent Clp protease ATP-binding subunit [Elusimicrobiota bacterium]